MLSFYKQCFQLLAIGSNTCRVSVSDNYLESDFNNFNLFAGFDLKDTNFAFELGYFKSG